MSPRDNAFTDDSYLEALEALIVATDRDPAVLAKDMTSEWVHARARAISLLEQAGRRERPR